MCSVDSYHSEHSNSHAPARTNVFSPTNDSVRRAAYSSSPLMHNAFSRVANWHVVQTGTNLFLRVSFQLPPGEAYRLHLHLHASRFSTIASLFLATFTYIALLLRHQHHVIHPDSSNIPPRLRRPPHILSDIVEPFAFSASFFLPSGQSVRRL